MPLHTRRTAVVSLARLRRMVAAAHAERRKLRFWATPDAAGPEREAVWRALLDAGADYLNSDDLPGLEAFLRGTAHGISGTAHGINWRAASRPPR